MNYIVSIVLGFILLIVILVSYGRIQLLLKTVYRYEEIIDSQGKKNHEYNNQLLVLLGYIDNKKKLKEYLYTIIEDHRTGQNYEIRQLANLKEGGIKKLLYYKIDNMKLKNIECNLYITEDAGNMIEDLHINEYKSLTKILGVLLDNSIDGALNSDEKEVFLDIKERDNKLIISISNTYGDDISLKKIGKSKYTTKGFGHGFGLSLVNDICNKNNNIDFKTIKENNMIKQEIIVNI